MMREQTQVQARWFAYRTGVLYRCWQARGRPTTNMPLRECERGVLA